MFFTFFFLAMGEFDLRGCGGGGVECGVKWDEIS